MPGEHVGWWDRGQDGLAVAVFVLALVLYAWAVRRGRHRGRGWPRPRSLGWFLGLVCCLAAVAGPLAERSHHSFPTHMVTHLLLGMVGPLLLVRAAPVTCALRALAVAPARRLVRVLDSRPVRVVAHPVTAGTANLVGLWLLYTTGLYASAQSHPVLHLLVHVHVLASGYLFTAAVVGVDPNRHRRSIGFRGAAVVLFAAGHAVLAKRIYAQPPPGVAVGPGELGAMVMYYGGDVVELVVLILLGRQWYSAAAPTGAVRSAT